MKIERTDGADGVTLKLVGCLDTAATPEFAKAIGETTGAASLTLDMTGLEFIASSALRELVATRKSRGAGFRIELRGLNEVVREVFDVTGLDTVFSIRA